MRLHAFNAKKEYQKLMFKQHKNKYIKYVTIILSVCLLVFAIMYFSFSKFSTTKKFNVINAKVGDFSSGDYTIAAYIDGTKSSTIPLKTDGYGVEKIECTNNATAKWDYNAWTVNISATTPTKCNIYFNASTLSNRILNIAGGTTVIAAKTTPNFANISTTDEGMFATPDDYGTSYYYRGAVTTNNVIFGGFCWKVIRINGDGTTRMIYNGTPTNGTCVATGTDTQIGTSLFNTYHNDNAYVGYMYGTPGSSTYALTHNNINQSIAKQTIDSWYSSNILNYANKISDTDFCDDRSIASTANTWDLTDTAKGYGSNKTYYGSHYRRYNTHVPTLICPNQNDRFTVSDSTVGNAKLTYPVGLITMDEVGFAGASISSQTTNSIFYLYTTSNYWTMTARIFNGGNCSDLFVIISGKLESNADNNVYTNGLRPVINLNSNVLYSSGDGTSSAPYVIPNN